MDELLDARVGHEFWVHPPVMNAAGSLGFAPDWRSGRDWSQFGAFVTNPVSLAPRSPARGMRYKAFTGGFILHTGYPNPGLRAVLRQYSPAWMRSELPVIVHLLAQDPGDIDRMVRLLEGQEGVAGVELGLPPDIHASDVWAFVLAGMGELPLIVRLPFERALELAPVAAEAGAGAVSLNAPRGALASPETGIIEGRVYGRAVFPFALQTARMLAGIDLPFIASGGVYSEGDIQSLRDAGAAAVQLDSWLWLDSVPR